MGLNSELLRGDRRLDACLVSDPQHLTEGTVGPFVQKVQVALFVVDGLRVDPAEYRAQRYGASTADAVLTFKRQRNIINRAYQQSADNVVGKMTIAALDRELLCKEAQIANAQFTRQRVARQRLASPSTPTSSVARNAGLTPTTASPAQVAKSRAPRGIIAVQLTRQRLQAMMQFHRQPTIPTNPLIMASFDRLWQCFPSTRSSGMAAGQSMRCSGSVQRGSRRARGWRRTGGAVRVRPRVSSESRSREWRRTLGNS